MRHLERPIEHKLLTEGVLRMITCHTKELPRTTMFGSTDRKSYTVEISLAFNDQQQTAYVEIDPWATNSHEIVADAEENAKHKFADWLYFNGHLNK